VALAALLAVAVGMAGCDVNPRTATLPGGVGTGDSGYEVTAVFPTADNLVDNSEVQYHDVRVGTVTAIELDHTTWHARVTMSIENNVSVPANVEAEIGQKSLLGAEYVQLRDPAATPVGKLADHPTIPLNRTNHYPETEEVLTAVSLLLNNGGLSQLRTITTELDKALSGREHTARRVLGRLTTFVGRLNDQKSTLIDATDTLNRLAGELADNRDTIAAALTHITPAVATLRQDRPRITKALVALGRLGRVASRVLNDNRSALQANLSLLRPVLTKLATAGKAIPDSLPLFVSFPFPVTTLFKAVKGDYMNLFETLDLSLDSVKRDFLGSLPVIGTLPLSRQAKNPLTAPLGQAAGH
jgi:phospholipid/cholesterol/gamma-HCH transport system substrate-binding protein